ncbi:hypothetical protein K8I85_09290, partial [bacterium]|nr:hypothetical protein [bacterium]
MEIRADPPGAPPGASSLLAERRRLIGRHFYTYTWVRVLVAATIVAAALVARYGLDMEALSFRHLAILAAWTVVYDALSWSIFRRYRLPGAARGSPPTAPQPLLAVTYAAVVLDFLTLTVGIWLVGGGRSPFVAFYLLHVMVTCLLLSRRAALALTGVA